MTTSGTAQRGNLQSKKQDLVRNEIWCAAIDLFYLEGFDEVTIDQIAERAGVSRRTFFRYFASKDDVMGSTMKTFGEALDQAIRAESASLSAFDVAKRSVAQVLMRQPSSAITNRVVQISKRSSAALSAQFLQLPAVEENLARSFAIRAGRSNQPSIDDRILASVAFAATKLCVDLWVDQPQQPVQEIVAEVFAKLSTICQATPPPAAKTRKSDSRTRSS